MTLLSLFQILNYGLVLLFGLFLSVFAAGGWSGQKERRIVFIACPVFLLVQWFFWSVWGVTTVERLYPLIAHLPLVLLLVFVLKKRVTVAVTSVCTAYLCCQIPRWLSLVAGSLTHSALVGEIGYTLFAIGTFILLYLLFVRSAYDTMIQSVQSVILFGSLPLAYYIFDYATTVYSDALHANTKALNEFLPTILIVFYVIFLTAYHTQEKKRSSAEMQNTILESELKQAESELEGLRRAETKTAVYQHDMRHHLNALEGLLAAGKVQQAEEFIKAIQEDVAAISPQVFCENETVNLLCSSFSQKAKELGIALSVNANLPREISVSDTELCSLISNGLENAIHAVSRLDEASRSIDFLCQKKHGKLLIEIKNPYSGTIQMKNGLPISAREGHGYGSISIRTIAERNRGLCVFEAKEGIFTLRAALPLD